MKEIEKKQEELKCEEIELLRTGMSDNANLLNDDELSELFGGYCSPEYCSGGYENKVSGVSCDVDFCNGTYY